MIAIWEQARRQAWILLEVLPTLLLLPRRNLCVGDLGRELLVVLASFGCFSSFLELVSQFYRIR